MPVSYSILMAPPSPACHRPAYAWSCSEMTGEQRCHCSTHRSTVSRREKGWVGVEEEWDEEGEGEEEEGRGREGGGGRGGGR